MDQDEYLSERLDDQIMWYDRESTTAKAWSIGLRTVQLILAASIPFMAGYASSRGGAVTALMGIFGALVAVITGLLGLLKLEENWIEYRTTCESLKHERYLFLAGVEPYDVECPFRLLVQRAETLISKENTNWASYIPGKEEKRDGQA